MSTTLQPPTSTATPRLQRWLRGGVESRFDRLSHGRLRLVEAWSGRERGFGSGEQVITLTVNDPGFYADLALGGSVGAAESFAAGDWDCDDLPGLVALMVAERDVLAGLEGGLARLSAPLRKLEHWLRPNTRRGSRRNIAAHYDLGNDFFELFLDETLTYSCAFFERDGMTLARASTAKLDRLCRKLDLRPGQHVLEIGCGWGSFALHAAGRYGVKVTATTISEAQHERAVERVAAAGLSERITILKQDYRDLTGRYDRLVSIEMIEAVGAPQLDTLLDTCGRLLEPDGLLGLQAITITDQHYQRALREVDFIKQHIFPGSFIPSVTAIVGAATRASDLRLLHLEDAGPHYAATLAAWRANLHAHWDAARALGHDEPFLRLWDFYLAYCQGGFAERFLGLAQMVFAKPGARPASLLPALPEPVARRSGA